MDGDVGPHLLGMEGSRTMCEAVWYCDSDPWACSLWPDSDPEPQEAWALGTMVSRRLGLRKDNSGKLSVLCCAPSCPWAGQQPA